jgi:hypothetical protein
MQAHTDTLLPAQCPFRGDANATVTATGLQAADGLSLPLHRRMVVQYAQREDGVRELHLYYGDKEISFDEPDLFAFGEQLARQDRFGRRPCRPAATRHRASGPTAAP